MSLHTAHPGRPRPLRSYLLPSIADLFFVIILFVLFFSSNSGLLGDGDTGFHIRTGEYILRTGSIPRFDIFSYHTPPLPWTAHEWLSEVAMAAVHQAFGMTGIVAFFSMMLAFTSYLLFKVLVALENNVLLAAMTTTLAFLASQIHWLARPHVFSFLLMIICQYLLERWRRDDRNRLYLLPPLMLLWANLHGGFVGGFLLMAAYFAGTVAGLATAPGAERSTHLHKAKQLAVAGVASLAACLVNPHGYHLLLFPFRLVSDSFIMDHVTEFLSPNFHNPMPFKYLLLLIVALFGFSRRKLQPTEFVLFLLFTNMALYAARYIPLFALVMAPVLTRHAVGLGGEVDGGITQFLRNRAQNMARIDATLRGHFWPAAAVAVVALTVICGGMEHGFDKGTKCVAATEFLMKEKIAGHVFNNDEFGDYLIYRGHKDYKVFIDGRLDMYGSERMKEYYTIVNFENGWEKVLERYGITWVFFDTNSSFSRFLQHDKRWILVYSDQVASIFVRDLPQYRTLIGKYRRNGLAPVPGKEHTGHA